MNEAVQGGDALHEALFHAGPLVRRDDAGNQVERNQALGAPVSSASVFVLGAINRKGDADAPENHFGFFTPCLHGSVGLTLQPVAVQLVMRPHLFGR